MNRLAALDAFRGFAIAAMMLVNNPGDWKHLYPPLAHAPWNGWTFTDMVFPFFLFAAGVSMAISVDRRTRSSATPGELMKQMARRAAVIFAVGLALNLVPAFDFSTVRIPGVLQRIALCVLVAAPIAIRGSTLSIGLAIAGFFAVYSLPMLLVGTLEPGQDFGSMIDRAVFGAHLWSQTKTWDPEGLWSTLPAVCSLLFGVLVGRSLPSPRRLLVLGLAALTIGWAMDAFFMPINKNLWTPSYAVFMTGWSLVAFAVFHAITPRWLVIFGMNALFLFALSGFIARIYPKAWLYAPIQSLPIGPGNASLLYAVLFDLAMFAVAWAMWKKGWFVKA